MKRTLSLKRERLAELPYADLASVVAGQQPNIPTLPLKDCFDVTRTSCNCCTGSASC